MSTTTTPPLPSVPDLRNQAKITAQELSTDICKLPSTTVRTLAEWLDEAEKWIDKAMTAVDELERLESDIPSVTGERLAPFIAQLQTDIRHFTAHSWEIYKHRHEVKELVGVADDAIGDAEDREREAEEAEGLAAKD